MFVHRCVTPGAVGLDITISGISAVPSASSAAVATALLMMQWAHGYSGCIGVLSIGCQVASRSVAALSSISPLRIAVIGRQNAYLYLASKTAIMASAAATEKSAIKRALFSRSIFFAMTI